MTHLTDTHLDATQAHEATHVDERVTVAQEIANSASRLGVLIGGQKVLLHLTDISEVLPVPPIQMVPLTKHWYLGVANVRGNLYSVTDLAQFLNGLPPQKNGRNRIVLLNSIKVTQAAILIDEVIGLRNVSVMQQATDKIDAIKTAWSENQITCFAADIYQDRDETIWLTLDVDALVQDNRFTQPCLA